MLDDNYQSLTSRERFELLDHASQERGLAPSILEKDYWVCKTLDVLFSLPDLGEHLVFKGGTSLSKVYQTILFHFPQAGAPSLSYIAPSVRIELGARSDHWPKERHEILSYLSEILSRPIGGATVQSLAAERTFWEKATLLHAETHRDPAKPMPARYARHYHDLARMAKEPVTERALADADLRKRVVAHKAVYFRSGWARYDLAEPATFQLLPPAARLPELEADQRAMAQMFFTTPPPISEVLETLASLQNRIRQLP